MKPLKNWSASLDSFKTIDTKQTFDALSGPQKINQANDWIIISSAIN